MKWFKGDEELKPSDRVKMEVTPKHAILTVKKADKDDEAPYRVEMENPSGKDNADLKGEVNDKEGMLCIIYLSSKFDDLSKICMVIK